MSQAAYEELLAEFSYSIDPTWTSAGECRINVFEYRTPLNAVGNSPLKIVSQIIGLRTEDEALKKLTLLKAERKRWARLHLQYAGVVL